MDKLTEIKSDKIRQITEYLLDKRHKITFSGQAWSNATGTWIYFDTKLNIPELQEMFDLKDDFEIHENLDQRSGTERGIVDKTTGEAIMGYL